MPYDFEPKDLDGSRTEREHATPDDEPRRAYERWLDESETLLSREIGGETSTRLYELAAEAIEPLDLSPVEATALPLAFPDRTTPEVGLFLSAAYNRGDADVVVFDAALPVEPRRLGFRLPAEKTLLLDAPVGSTMAVGARGLVVNRTTVDRYFGYSGEGAFVNCGTCLTLGFDAARASIDVGEVRGGSGVTAESRGVALDDPDHSSVALTGRELPPELDAYLDDVELRLGRGVERARSFLANLDGPPADALVDELVARLPDHLAASNHD